MRSAPLSCAPLIARKRASGPYNFKRTQHTLPTYTSRTLILASFQKVPTAKLPKVLGRTRASRCPCPFSSIPLGDPQWGRNEDDFGTPARPRLAELRLSANWVPLPYPRRLSLSVAQVAPTH